MSGPPGTSLILRVACRTVSRLIQVYALYVIFHGHYSPGGGFQGGALLATSIILLRIGEGKQGSEREFPERLTLVFGSLGALIYAAVGVISLFAGGEFLNYDWVPFPGMSEPYRHYWSVLIIEIGVGLAVMSILVAIFDRLIERAPDA